MNYSPRMTAELRRRGWTVNHKRVERLMRQHGIDGYRPRRRRSLTKPDQAAPPAPDLLGRLFDPARTNVAWCGDVTYIPTEQGWLYLASVIDLGSRRLLGYAMGTGHDADLVVRALEMAVATRGRPQMHSTIFHTDHGSEPSTPGWRSPSGWPTRARWPRSAPEATPTTTPWPRRSTACTRPN
jgi:transposase InsO family protein